MKNILRILLFIPILLSTRCKHEKINIDIANKSNNDLIFTNCKDTISLRLQLIQNSENTGDLNYLNYIPKRTSRKIVFDEYDLDFYTYFENNEKYYKFYYLIYEKIDNKIIFKNSIDSVFYRIDEFKIGENKDNKFFYANNKLNFVKRH